jgi:hypothetical protein
MEMHHGGIFDNQLLQSLGIIQAAKTQLRLLTASNSTPAALASKIGLCDLLLDEIHAIRVSLEGRLGQLRHQRSLRRSTVAVKRNRSHGCSIVQQRNLAIPPGQGK